MKYPDFNPALRNTTLFDGLVADIARTELSIDRDEVDPRSLAIARLCVAYFNCESTLPEIPKRRYIESAGDHRGVNSMFSALYDMLIVKDDIVQATEKQRNLHEALIRSLRAGVEHDSRFDAGVLPERACLGLLTRYAHPEMIAYPALSHHENDHDVAGHFDVGVIIKNPDNTIDARHLQVKSTCFGLCGTKPASRYYEPLRRKYRPFVQMVSGCCHLNMGTKRGSKIKIAELLIREADDNITTAEVKRLDTISDTLLLNMTSSGLPRGGASIPSFHFDPEIFDRL